MSLRYSSRLEKWEMHIFFLFVISLSHKIRKTTIIVTKIVCHSGKGGLYYILE